MCTVVLRVVLSPRGFGVAWVLLLMLVLLVPAAPVSAEILAGRIGASGSTEANVVTAFRDDASGDAAPSFLLGGPATGLETANGLSFDPVGRTLLVADFFGQKVVVFDIASRGDASPLRSFTSPIMSQPRRAVAIPEHGEIAVVSAFFIQYYPLLADGTVAPVRNSTFQPALLNNVATLVYLRATDEVAVGDYYDASGGTFAGEVLFFDRTASGTLVPSRRIAGPATGLGAVVLGLALDEGRGEMFVLAGNADGTGAILVFPFDAEGDTPPIRSITGPATQLFNASSIAFDAERGELLVANAAYNAPAPQLLAFPRLANGDVAPSRVIAGPATGVVAPDGWFSVLSLPLSELFRDGFESP